MCWHLRFLGRKSADEHSSSLQESAQDGRVAWGQSPEAQVAVMLMVTSCDVCAGKEDARMAAKGGVERGSEQDGG